MRLVKQLVVVAVVAMAGSLLVGAVNWNPILTLVLGPASAVAALAAYRWIVRRTEHREVVELARPGAGRAIGRGVLIGVGLFAAVILNIALLGGYRVGGWGSFGGTVALLGFMTAAAVTEELFFRGILFRIVEGRFGTWWALGLTGLLFGLSHLFNPHASLWGAIAIAIEAGGMLAAAYAATRTLWVPIGLHFGWNFAEAGLFGTAVSGSDTPAGLVHGVMSGPAALTGGSFGPEGSLYSVLAGLLTTVVFMWLARRRGHIVARRRGTEPAATLVP
ncbi:CPBP family intramembrane glutamic endopeptidase [Paractinoplanes durhamensis]|uniref:CAAX amino protease n=1 Tax=Paractinoplanes durhamensis TaxID=113563 RepID=A0ABQ3YZM0_9ACTN|nr:CPBP family intramembrane glutamic endopeptidase [Actinoplanes durhamensis]GIE03023.1 CAAX amino protease [Actinoplanes durhamensis]